MFKFEDKIKDIDRLLEMRRSQWMLTHIMSYEDICQIIRIHLHKKFDYWDQSRPFDQWASRIITRQIINEVRNNYGRLTPPCIKGKGCPFNTGEGCQFTKSGKKDESCAAYSKWLKSKKSAYELKIAAPLEDYDGASRFSDFNFEKTADKFHKEMKKLLTEKQYLAYTLIFVDGLSDIEVAKRLNLTTGEKNRIPGYRQISNLKKELIRIGKEVVDNMDFEY